MFPPEQLHDLDDLAGLIANLDGVVSVQNTTVHLAGALGVSCLALVPVNPEWRYLRSGERMPWYGSVRMIRQTTPGDWSGVVSEAATRLDGAARQAL